MKKKLFYIFTAAAAMLLCFTLSAFAQNTYTEEDIEKLEQVENLFFCGSFGDVDGDGDITASDSRLALRASVQLEILTPERFRRADIDRDNILSAADSRGILRIAVSLDEQLEHKTESYVIVAATCTAPGYSVTLCDFCNKIYSERIIAPARHTAGVWVDTVEADCRQTGIAQLNCIYCSELIKEEVTAKTAHRFGSWVYPNGKNCLEPTEKYRDCTVCSYRENRVETPLSQHNLQWQTSTPASCLQQGALYYRCAECGYETGETQLVEALGHIEGEWTTEKKAGCTENGIEVKSCIRCGELLSRRDTQATGHDYNNKHYQLTLEPTCSQNGRANALCLNCGEAKELILEKLPHSYIRDWETQALPACDKPGLKTAECLYCGEISESIPALAHTPEWIVISTAECDKPGLNELRCTVCLQKLDEQASFAEHSFSDEIISTSAPTCTQPGSGYKYCEACSETKAVSIPATGIHIKGDVSVVISEATADSPEKRAYLCRHCGEIMPETQFSPSES